MSAEKITKTFYKVELTEETFSKVTQLLSKNGMKKELLEFGVKEEIKDKGLDSIIIARPFKDKKDGVEIMPHPLTGINRGIFTRPVGIKVPTGDGWNFKTKDCPSERLDEVMTHLFSITGVPPRYFDNGIDYNRKESRVKPEENKKFDKNEMRDNVEFSLGKSAMNKDGETKYCPVTIRYWNENTDKSRLSPDKTLALNSFNARALLKSIRMAHFISGLRPVSDVDGDSVILKKEFYYNNCGDDQLDPKGVNGIFIDGYYNGFINIAKEGTEVLLNKEQAETLADFIEYHLGAS